MKVKDNWQLVQCTNCDKVNKIPGNIVPSDNDSNHPDISYPYIVTT
jgi:hypothetical protein